MLWLILWSRLIDSCSGAFETKNQNEIGICSHCRNFKNRRCPFATDFDLNKNVFTVSLYKCMGKILKTISVDSIIIIRCSSGAKFFLWRRLFRHHRTLIIQCQCQSCLWQVQCSAQPPVTRCHERHDDHIRALVSRQRFGVFWDFASWYHCAR